MKYDNIVLMICINFMLFFRPPTYINSKHTAMEVQPSVITVGRFCMDCYTKDSSVMVSYCLGSSDSHYVDVCQMSS